DETAVFTGNVQQTLSEIRLMKASNAEEIEKKNGIAGVDKLYQYGLREAKVMALIGPLMSMIIMLVIVVIIGYGGMRVASGMMSTGSLVAFLLYLFQIIMPVTLLAMFFTQLQKAKGATERIIGILELQYEAGQEGLETDVGNKSIQVQHGSSASEEGQEGLETDVGNKSIQVQNVSFAYEQGEQVLTDISFEAKPGQMIAFAGPSGGGKTTMFGLLERFYEPDEGTIMIGDTPISDLTVHSWRSHIGYVPQESAMMAGTIRENLCYGFSNWQDIPDERLWEVTEMAYAKKFIENFPDGLDTEVGERGIKLSGGQKQRIAIARAFLRNPKILMMDEATASLDSQSEQVVQQALNRL